MSEFREKDIVIIVPEWRDPNESEERYEVLYADEDSVDIRILESRLTFRPINTVRPHMIEKIDS